MNSSHQNSWRILSKTFLLGFVSNNLAPLSFKYLLISLHRYNAKICTLVRNFSEGKYRAKSISLGVIDCHNQTVVSSSVIYVLLLVPDGAAAVGLIMATDGCRKATLLVLYEFIIATIYWICKFDIEKSVLDQNSIATEYRKQTIPSRSFVLEPTLKSSRISSLRFSIPEKSQRY